MKNFTPLFIALLLACQESPKQSTENQTILKNATIIDGTGKAPYQADLLISGDTIAGIGNDLNASGATSINLTGKTVMPSLISAHVHIGNVRGTSVSSANYTRENILSQLKKYQNYGVQNIQILGTDRPFIFESGFRDSSRAGMLPGARMRSAGFGFATPGGAPAAGDPMDKLFRPSTPGDVPREMDSLAAMKPDMVKIWVDDFGKKTTPKMDPLIYTTIIREAHKHGLRVTAHVYYLADARKLVAAGVDVLGHSIRDSVADDAFLAQMKAYNVAYIPTLSLDEFAFIYAGKAEWINDAFFKAALEPGVYEMITSEKYQNDLKNSPDYARNMKGFDIALKNLKKIFDAGILVAFGTDSGANPVRAQGFSEHLELQLMVQAGLTPSDAIVIATKNSATLLKADKQSGTIETGRIADLLILDADPLSDIKNSRKISAVYKAGKKVSEGSPR
jgi:imidazolonepropionase-like amidohydrolase